MQEFLKELIRIEINDKEKCFNGYYSAEAYTKYLNELYAAANMSILVDERYAAILHTQLKDFMTMLDAYLPMFAETVEDMRHDAEVDKNLKCEYDWYKMLFDIRNAKIYYYEELMNIMSPQVIVKSDGEVGVKELVDDKPKLAKGVEEIAKVLGCGKTKANEIIQSGFMKEYEVGHYNGRTPVLEIDKWERLPSELKSKICKKRS
jgi:hypothetical protein